MFQSTIVYRSLTVTDLSGSQSSEVQGLASPIATYAPLSDQFRRTHEAQSPSRRTQQRVASGRTCEQQRQLGRLREPLRRHPVLLLQSHPERRRGRRMPLHDMPSSGPHLVPKPAVIRSRLAADGHPAVAVRTQAGRALRKVRPSVRLLYGSAVRGSPTSPRGDPVIVSSFQRWR